MKILHVISSTDSVSGGPVTVLVDLTRYQCKAGHEVDVCTTNRGNPTTKVLERSTVAATLPDDVELHCFDVDFAPLLYSRSMAHWLRKALPKYEIIHVHGLYRFPPTYAARCARKLGVPYVIRPHGSLDPYLYRQSSRSLLLKRLYERWFDMPNLRAAGSIHYTAQEERERAEFLRLQTPSFVVPNGIDGARYARLPERGAFRARLNVGDAPLVLFLGRLNFKKGLDLLVPAFDLLRRSHPLANLAIVGPDNEGYGRKVRSWVHARGLGESVHFVGHLDGTPVLEAYVDADVFVLPSYTENFGMTVVEAMACATPVVISDQVNIHREIAAAGAGLVTPCAVEIIADALDAVLSDKTRAAAMGTAGRRAALDHYTWPPIVQALTHEYETVIAKVSTRATAAHFRERNGS